MKFNCKFVLVAATVLTVAPILSFPNITTTVQATTKKAQAAKNTIQVNKAPIIYDRAGNYNSKYHQNIKAGTRLKYSGKTYIIQQRFAAGIPVPTSRIIGGKLYYSIGKGGYVKESDVLTWLGNTNTSTAINTVYLRKCIVYVPKYDFNSSLVKFPTNYPNM